MDNQQPTLGSQEYNEQMSTKFQNQSLGDVDTEEELPVAPMPENGQEKFYNKSTGEYDWANHAKELEYRLSQNKRPEEEAPKAEENKVKDPSQDALDSIYKRANLNPTDLQAAIDNNGDLDENQYAALEKAGVPRDVTRQFIENYGYRRDAMITEALTYVGGEQNWQQMSDWGVQNLSQGEINEYNRLLASGEWRIAVDAMRVRMGDSAPHIRNEPNLITGSESVTGSTFGYRSKSEMKQDMSNPRYQKDPAFRREVAQKMASATWELDAQ
jgi:hypothetical protein